MSKSLGNLVDLHEQIDRYGPDAVRVTMLFASPPEDDIDWADVSPTGSVKWLGRVWRLARDVAAISPGKPPASGDLATRQHVHRLISQATTLMEAKRFNVALARLMELTSLLRKAIDTGPGAADPAVREGAEALAGMLSCFAPFTAEEAWERLGAGGLVNDHAWPEADPALVVEETVTCVVQVAGKVRARLQVPPDISEDELRELALRAGRVVEALGGANIQRIVVKAPKIVSIVPG